MAASQRDTVIFLRTRLATFALIASVLTATVAPALAGQAHPVCVTKDHGCGQTATIARCCCGEQGPASTQNGPVEARVQVVADLNATPGMFVVMAIADVAERVVHERTFPPGATPPDLTTLFATFLI